MLRYRRESLLAAIQRVLRPVVGELMAGAAVKAHVKQLRITGDWVEQHEVDALLQSIDKGTRVFVGARRSSELIAKIWEGLATDDEEGTGELGVSVEYFPTGEQPLNPDLHASESGEMRR